MCDACHENHLMFDIGLLYLAPTLRDPLLVEVMTIGMTSPEPQI